MHKWYEITKEGGRQGNGPYSVSLVLPNVHIKISFEAFAAAIPRLVEALSGSELFKFNLSLVTV